MDRERRWIDAAIRQARIRAIRGVVEGGFIKNFNLLSGGNGLVHDRKLRRVDLRQPSVCAELANHNLAALRQVVV
ncbi:hypothetical protein SDC9_146765 [bioreactor metagenome]|uniref:Uncharacterized protein n=1 Tax=bioreactor metagenome TaxID=1076179 RepID=A0A645EFP0_9ZZZZ